MSVTIRSAGPADAGTIAALEDACFSDAAGEATLRSYLSSPACRYCLALNGSDPVGYCGVTAAADEAEILNIAVLPAYRRNGVARRMLVRMLAEACALGARTMYLEVRAGAAPVRALYDSLGFEETGTRKNYYVRPREDAILMKRPLTENDGTEL